MSDEQIFLSRLFLVFNRLFCSYGNWRVLLQLCIFSVIPSSFFISGMCTLLLLWKPGWLVPLLHVPVVLGFYKEIAALMGNEGAIFYLSQILGGRDQPWGWVCRKVLGPTEVLHCVCPWNVILYVASHRLLSECTDFPRLTSSSVEWGWRQV